MEVPGCTHANVVVAVAIPVVDVKAILVEVADTRDVVNVVGVDRRERMLSISVRVTES